MLFPAAFNFLISNRIATGIIKKSIGFAHKRPLPILSLHTLKGWARKNLPSLHNTLTPEAKVVYFFIDEFSNYNDTEIGRKAILLLSRLNYRVIIAPISNSARAFISKGLLRTARKIAIGNVESMADIAIKNVPIIGIEPSAILSFRDEYSELLKGNIVKVAMDLAQNTLMIDEFLASEITAGKIDRELFTKKTGKIKLHGHCQQKAIASTDATKKILAFPQNYQVEEIKSGCCGMAGSFGYEKEHYDISMKIGEMVLFPEVRKSETDTIIAAPGTSCREHIQHGTGRIVKHPVEILYDALI